MRLINTNITNFDYVVNGESWEIPGKVTSSIFFLQMVQVLLIFLVIFTD